MYATKASEKVNNLSKELLKLSVYLEQELEREYDIVEDSLTAKEERIASSIHIINTLKSINDTALSDWKGVIGDIIEKQKEEDEKRVKELERIINVVSDMVRPTIHVEGLEGPVSSIKELDSVKDDIKLILSGLGLKKAKLPKSRKTKHEVLVTCPECTYELQYKQRKNKSKKLIICKNCGATLLSKWDGEEAVNIKVCESIEKTFMCPYCDAQNIASIADAVGANAHINCEACDEILTISRASSGINIKPKNRINSREVSDDFIEKVSKLLPAQPWEKGTHKTIAKELGTSNAHVSRAIDILITRGDYNPQFDGKLYSVMESKE